MNKVIYDLDKNVYKDPDIVVSDFRYIKDLIGQIYYRRSSVKKKIVKISIGAMIATLLEKTKHNTKYRV